jgi:hypothetical protein
MNAPGVADALYPVVLAFANLAAGVGLYETGALVLPLVLWLGGVLVLVGIVSSIGSRVVALSIEPMRNRFWTRI